MTTPTRIDQAHADMTAQPEDNGARLRFYARLAEAELFLLLKSDAGEDVVEPQTFEMEDQTFVPEIHHLHD